MKNNIINYQTVGEKGRNTRNGSQLDQKRIDMNRCKIFCNFWGIRLYNCLPEEIKTREEKEFTKIIENTLIKKAYYSIEEAVVDKLGMRTFALT